VARGGTEEEKDFEELLVPHGSRRQQKTNDFAHSVG
jgi:hypothetical protein